MNCPVATYQLYTSKLDPRSEYIWQKPKQDVNYSDPVWYEPRRVGHNPLETFMKTLSKEANLSSNRYTNHSIRSTCITRLDNNGFEARHITAISSHKSESTIREYSVKCPENKRKEMFDALEQDIKQPKIPKLKHNVPIPDQNAQAMTSNNNTLNVTIPTASDVPNFSNIDLLEMDNTDDQLLVDILTQTEKTLNNNDNSGTVTNVQQYYNNWQIPKMYFPNSNVTINYNFSK